jgi:membrane-bound inhibitor of C-type lysozyme
MYRQPTASGSKYQGRNETFWEHHGEATVTWGFEAPGMVCRRAKSR